MFASFFSDSIKIVGQTHPLRLPVLIRLYVHAARALAFAGEVERPSEPVPSHLQTSAQNTAAYKTDRATKCFTRTLVDGVRMHDLHLALGEIKRD